MPNSYPRDGIFNSHLAAIKDSYILNIQDKGRYTTSTFRRLPVT